MGTINATLTGVMTLDEFIALGGIAEWTVDDFTPHGLFIDPIASFEGTIFKQVDLWQTIELPNGMTKYRLDAHQLEGVCFGRMQGDVGQDGLDLKSLLLNNGKDCFTFHHEEFDPHPVPEASTLILLVVGLFVWWWRR